MQGTSYQPPLFTNEDAKGEQGVHDAEHPVGSDKHWDSVHGIVEGLFSRASEPKIQIWHRSKFWWFRAPIDLHHQTEAYYQHWRQSLGKALESEFSHWAILALILVDVLATCVDIVLTLHTKANDVKECKALLEQCSGPESWEPHSTEHKPLFFVSASILALLCLNIVLLLVAFGWRFFRHPGYVLDLIIIPTALFLEIFLDSEVLVLLIILNLWRLIRVAHGVFTVTDDAMDEEIEHLRVRLAMLQKHSKEIKEELEETRARLQSLEGARER